MHNGTSGRMNRWSLVLVAILVHLCTGVMAHGQSNLFVNGSFEAPALASDSWQVLTASDSSITGWTWSAPSAGYGLLINGHGPGGTATILGPQNGSQFLELDYGTAGGNVLIEQTVSGLTSGGLYNVNGFYGWDHRSGAEWGHFKVSVVGVGDILPNTLVSNDLQWAQFSAPFTAPGTSATIQIISLGLNGAQQTSIDNVSLFAAIPEPGTAGLVMASLLVCGAIMKFKKSRSE